MGNGDAMTPEQQGEAAPETIAAVLDAATARLAAAGSASPRLDAEVLLRHVLGLDGTALFLRLRQPLAPAARVQFDALLAERSAGKPVAYLTGTRDFFGLPIAVAPGVLVPRPETELLVEWARAQLKSRPDATVVDVGTGSGAIALALAVSLAPDWHGRIVAADVSAAALAVAARNRARLGVSRCVALVRGDLVAWCGGPVDLLLANLPYLTPAQVAANPDLRAEPELALVGGADGLGPIRRLLADAPRVVAPGGAIALEIDSSQAAAVAEMLRIACPRGLVVVRPDLAGLPRHVVATGC